MAIVGKIFGNIGKKILAWFLIISIIPATILTAIWYYNGKKLIEKQITEVLETTVYTIGEEIFHVLEAKKDKLINFSADGLIRENLAVISSGEPGNEAIVEKINQHLRINKLPLDHDILGALVIDLHGKVVASSDETQLGMDVSDKDYFTQGLRFGIYVSDLYFSHLATEPIMTMSRIMTNVKTGVPVGMMVIVIKGHTFSYIAGNWDKDVPRFHDEERPCKVYIVNEDYLMITESGFVSGQVADTEPVRRAFFRNENMGGIYLNYKGVSVLGTSLLLDKPRWVIITEKALTEVMEPINGLRNIGFGLSSVDAVIVIIVAFFITRSLTAPLRKLVIATERVAKGDLDYRILTAAKDEIGLLSNSFNEMTHNLKKSRGELRALFDEGVDAMFVLCEDERITDVNKSACALVGLERNALIGTNISELISNRETMGKKKVVVEAVRNTWTLQVEGKYPTLDVSLTSKEGEKILCELDLKRIDYGIYAVFRDVTVRKQLEQAVVVEKQRLDDIVSEIGAGLSLVDKNMKVVWMNKIQSDWFGSLKEIQGKKCYNAYWHNKEICQGCPTMKTLASGAVEKSLMSCTAPDGKQKYYSVTSSPLKDHIGQVTHVLELIEDITKEKQADDEFKRMHESALQANIKLEQSVKELQLTQRQLIQAEKMASLGQLAASVSHEINNPLSYIDNNLDILNRYSERMGKFLKKCEEAEPIFKKGKAEQKIAFFKEVQDLKREIKLDFMLEDFGEVVKESRAGVEQIKRIVSNLSTFAHVGEDVPRYADINKVIEGVLAMVWGEVRYKAEIIKEYGNIPEIKCYPQQLGQVFMNILTNAAHAIEGKGKIWIKTYRVESNICVEIKDTGKGIPEELQPKVFDPFFTTKEPGKGTGLGLTVAQGIVQKHFGKIDISSKVGEGTIFTVILPIKE